MLPSRKVSLNKIINVAIVGYSYGRYERERRNPPLLMREITVSAKRQKLVKVSSVMKFNNNYMSYYTRYAKRPLGPSSSGTVHSIDLNGLKEFSHS